MIVVDEIVGSGAPWRGARSCHLMSDTSVRELLEFARSAGMPWGWLQKNRDTPHFDLSPSYRARAIAAGAVPCDRRGFVEAMRRYRERNPDRLTKDVG